MKTSKGGIEIIILLIIIFASFAFVGGFSPVKRNSSSNNKAVIVRDILLSSPGYTLQLKNLSAVTPTPIPTPSNSCNHDNGIPNDPSCKGCENAWLVECRNEQCAKLWPTAFEPSGSSSCESCINYGTYSICYGKGMFDGWCSKTGIAKTDGVYCIGKPVIYLYPTKKTTVDVKVDIPGKIIESDPLYPSGGWKDVEAYPDGKLIYKGRQYHELYYESAVSKINPPENGLVVTKNNIEKTLKDLTTRLGLISFEQKELVDYWLPKLNELNSPYLLISVVDQKEKERIDHVEITPAPDTKIEFLLYFKPLDKPIDIKSLELLEIPKRIGFTSVEWGGTIDNN